MREETTQTRSKADEHYPLVNDRQRRMTSEANRRLGLSAMKRSWAVGCSPMAYSVACDMLSQWPVLPRSIVMS